MLDRTAGAGLLAIVAALLLAFAAKGLLLRPPAPVAAPEMFDTARAAERLGRILGDERPHPVDSLANDAVRQRLVAELRAIGLKPQVRETMDCNGIPKSRSVSCSLTRNVVASIGPAQGRRLLLNAHYDSTPTGPGASDDGIGIAIMLEVAQLLRNAPPARPVTLLFNEGEEFGLNGARAFIENDPLAGQVDRLINIESRGVSGPGLMFETSLPNGPAIDLYSRAAVRPYANSLSADFATLIPNTTDVTVFKERGWTTLNYSIIGNEARYHTPGDTLAALDRASLAHLGSEVLAATQTLANDGRGLGGGRKVYTDVAGRAFLALPLWLAALALAGLVGGVAVVAHRRKAIGRPLAVVAGSIIAAILAAALAVYLAAMIRPGDYWRATPLVAYLGVYATILAAQAAFLTRFARRIDRNFLRIACWMLILVVGCLLAIVVPGATIFFLVAPLIALIAMLVPRFATPLFWAAALVQLVMFAELLALIEMLLIDGPLWAVAPLSALAALPFLIEALPGARPRRDLLVITGAALALWIAALIVPYTSNDRPGAFTIDYVRDDLRGKANWTVASKQAPLPQGWDRFGRWEAAVLPHNGRRRWATKAPALEVPRPLIRLLSSTPEGAGRTVRLALGRGGGDMIALKFAKDVKIVAMGLAGRPRPIASAAEPGPSFLRCTGRSWDSLVVEVRLADRNPVKAELIGTRFALPPEGKLLAAARPPRTHPQYAPDSSVRIRGVTF